MRTNNLPISRRVDDVSTGSLVNIPGENRWAIKTDEGLFTLDNLRLSNVNGKVADFRTGFRISVVLDNVVRASFPFMRNETPPGVLALFEADGVAIHSVVVDIDMGNVMQTIDILSGQISRRGQGSPEGLVYLEWSLEVKVSDDQYEPIHQHQRPE